jgi:hypothetical protein
LPALARWCGRIALSRGAVVSLPRASKDRLGGVPFSCVGRTDREIRTGGQTARSGAGVSRGHRLPHLAGLGIDAICLSPIFTSPMADFGYNIAIHRCRSFVRKHGRPRWSQDGAHRNKLKVILDLVPNLTSDQHPWFIESKASRDHPEGDWYIWRDPGPDGTRRIISFQNSAEARGNSNDPNRVLLGVFQSNALLLTMAAISTVFASPINFLSSPRTYRMHTSFCRRSEGHLSPCI